MLNSQDFIADKLNEEPTMMLGLTQSEVLSLALKCGVICLIPCLLLGLILGGFFLSIFLMLGVGLSAGGLVFSAKYIVAPRKAGKPFGYKSQKRRANGILVVIGLVKPATIRSSKLWCHKRLNY
jgi:conjugative transfer region protein (TIGR03750 family)